MSRLGLWTALLACWLAGCILGIAGVALRTDAGRDFVARTAVRLVNDRIDGNLSIGDLGGSFFEGLQARNVLLTGPAGDTVVALAELRLRYRLADLLSRRIVLGQLVLEQPEINLTQFRAGGPFNFELLFQPDDGESGGEAEGGSDGSSALLVAFSDVQIRDGSLVIRTAPDKVDDPDWEIESGPEGPLRVRRIEQINGEFSYLRLASPRPQDRGLLGEIASLQARISDPAIAIDRIRGSARLVGDSLSVDLAEVRLPQSAMTAEGTVVFSSEGLLFDLGLDVSRVVTDEVRDLIPELPAGLIASADIHAQQKRGDVLEVDARALEVEGAGGGGTARGRFGVWLGPNSAWAFRNIDLSVRNLDLEYVRGFLDTLPIAGRLTGAVKANGPRERLAVELDVILRDSLVPGWPESTIRGAGHILLGSGDLTFEDFTVRGTNLDLGTMHRLVPGIALKGRLRAQGRLNGTFRELRYEGLLRHRDFPGPESGVRGSLRVDAPGDSVGVWADVLLDTLHLAGLQSSYPAIPVAGGFTGRLVVAGYLDSLAMQALLIGSAGRIDLGGAVILQEGAIGIHTMTMGAEQLNLRALHDDLPESAINGDATIAGVTAEDEAARWKVDLALVRSRIRDIPIDSAHGTIALADTLIRADTVDIWSERVYATGQGAFGLAASRSGVLTVALEADSIGVLEPVLVSLLGEVDSTFVGIPPSGAVSLSGEMRGSIDDFDVDARFDVRDVSRGDLFVSRARGTARLHVPFENATIEGTMDSVALGAASFSGVEARVSGGADSMAWFGRARFGSTGAWIGGGQVLIDSTTYTVPIDSMAFLLTTGAWFVDTAAVVTLSDSGIDFRRVLASSAVRASRVTLDGRFPFRGPADLQVEFEAVSLGDVAMAIQKFAGQMDGELSGTIQLGGTARAPTIEAAAALRDGEFQTLRIPYLDGTMHYNERHFGANFALLRRGERFVDVTVELPIDLALRGVENRKLPGELLVQAVADSAPLAYVEAVLPVMRRGSGTLTATVGITGTWEDPRLEGSVTITDGAASFPAIGVRHEQLTGRLVLAGEMISIERLSVKSGRGTAEISGSVRLEELTRPVLDLHISGRDFHAVNLRDFLSLTATAELDLKGPPLGATLTGSGTATRGVLYFADLVTKQVINLEDTLFASFVEEEVREQRLGAEWQQRFLDSLRVVDLRLRLGNEVWLRSSEANIQLAGELTANKLRDQYRLTGTLEAPRGTYRLPLGPITRDFAVTRGQLRYFGTSDLNADVDIEARHVVRTVRGEDVTVFVHIGGTLYDPRLTLSSDIRPSPSETEVISYLLFGAPSVQALAAETRGENQGLQNQAVTQLAGVLSGQLEYALISDLGVPLDYVQIRPGDIGSGLSGTEIAIGKQFNLLGTTAFLTASPRICPEQTFSAQNVGASLEFRLSRQWLFAASADPIQACDGFSTSQVRYQFGLDFLWEKSY